MRVTQLFINVFFITKQTNVDIHKSIMDKEVSGQNHCNRLFL